MRLKFPYTTKDWDPAAFMAQLPAGVVAAVHRIDAHADGAHIAVDLYGDATAAQILEVETSCLVNGLEPKIGEDPASSGVRNV